jgi:hypothetical protein
MPYTSNQKVLFNVGTFSESSLNQYNTSTLSVANEIFSFAQFLHYGLHINIVVIGELLWRDPMRVHTEYNKNVTDTNSALYNTDMNYR